VSLVNNKLTIRHSDGSNETTILKSIQEIEEVIQEEFQLPKLPVKDVIKVLEELKIDIFTPVH
jgi:N-hydroxyarylamine O-acetyltransferase